MGIGSEPDLVVKWPQVHTWSDGSVAGWGDDLPGMPVPDSGVTFDDGVDRPEESVVQLQIGGADPRASARCTATSARPTSSP
jgi:hypothetical protein